jgi:catalase
MHTSVLTAYVAVTADHRRPTLPWSRPGSAALGGGLMIEGDFQLAGGSSVLFDTVFVALSAKGAEMLSTEAAAVAWVHGAFAHCKAIGATKESQPLLNAARVIPDEGVVVAEGLMRFWMRPPRDASGMESRRSRPSIK